MQQHCMKFQTTDYNHNSRSQKGPPATEPDKDKDNRYRNESSQPALSKRGYPDLFLLWINRSNIAILFTCALQTSHFLFKKEQTFSLSQTESPKSGTRHREHTHIPHSPKVKKKNVLRDL